MQRFREILVLAPPGPDTARVILRAADLAARNRARLTLFDVVPGLDARRRHVEHGDKSIDLQELLVEARRQELDELAATVMTAETRTAVEVGVRFISVIDRVQQYEHDLVIGAPNTSSSRNRIADDSTMLHLLRKCPCPVWVDDPVGWGRNDVLVAIGPFPDDGSIGQLNRTLLELGTSLARIQHGQLHVVHAWRLDGEHLLRNSKVRVPAGDIEALANRRREGVRLALRRNRHLRTGSAAAPRQRAPVRGRR